MKCVNLKRRVLLALGFLTVPLFIWLFAFWLEKGYLPFVNVPSPNVFVGKLQYRELKTHPLFPSLIYPQAHILQPMRTDVLTVAPWLAPIIWEGTFNSELLENFYKPLNLTIGVTAFAVGKYTQFVRHFLESAEKYFMMGYRVTYYIFTDKPKDIPVVPLQAKRTLDVIFTKKEKTWEEMSMRRMELINRHITKRAGREVHYLFCLDIDMMFHNSWGAETLGEMVAAVHPCYYNVPRISFPYERRRASSAYIPEGEGDFYYAGAMFGGSVKNVYEFTLACHMGILADKANGLMAIYQEESHLNRRFLSQKPSKLLSPEYLWDDAKPPPPELKLVRFSTVVKNNREFRE